MLCTPHITNSNNNIIIAATGIAVQTYTNSFTMHLSFGIPMDLKGESQISVNLKDIGMADRNVWVVKIAPFLFG